MGKVFISYTKEDRERAERLADDLERHGVEIWIDSRDLKPGQNWQHEITKAIRASEYFLAFLSRRSLSRRGYVQKEIRIALEILEEFPIDDSFFIPVRLEECQPADDRIQALQWVNLFHSYEKGLEAILDVLKPPEKPSPKPPEKISLKHGAATILYSGTGNKSILMLQTFADRGGPSYHLTNPRGPLRLILKVYGNRRHPIPDSLTPECISNAIENILEFDPDVVGLGGMGSTAREIKKRLKEFGSRAEIAFWGGDVGIDAGTFLRRYGAEPPYD